MPAPKDLRQHTPEKKSDLTKDNMLKFIQGGSEEDKKWFVDLMKKYRTEKTNNLTNEKVDGYDMANIREEFAKRFFKEISKEYKKKKAKAEKPFEKGLKELEEKLLN